MRMLRSEPAKQPDDVSFRSVAGESFGDELDSTTNNRPSSLRFGSGSVQRQVVAAQWTPTAAEARAAVRAVVFCAVHLPFISPPRNLHALFVCFVPLPLLHPVGRAWTDSRLLWCHGFCCQAKARREEESKRDGAAPVTIRLPSSAARRPTVIHIDGAKARIEGDGDVSTAVTQAVLLCVALSCRACSGRQAGGASCHACGHAFCWCGAGTMPARSPAMSLPHWSTRMRASPPCCAHSSQEHLRAWTMAVLGPVLGPVLGLGLGLGTGQAHPLRPHTSHTRTMRCLVWVPQLPHPVPS